MGDASEDGGPPVGGTFAVARCDAGEGDEAAVKLLKWKT